MCYNNARKNTGYCPQRKIAVNNNKTPFQKPVKSFLKRGSGKNFFSKKFSPEKIPLNFPYGFVPVSISAYASLIFSRILFAAFSFFWYMEAKSVSPCCIIVMTFSL